MPGQARLGDFVTGICCCHSDPKCRPVSGFIATGDSTVLVNGLPTAQLGGIVILSCGHTSIIVTASPNTLASGLTQARLGDSIAGCATGIIVTASANVFTN